VFKLDEVPAPIHPAVPTHARVTRLSSRQARLLPFDPSMNDDNVEFGIGKLA
jgi:hypothetical protein